MASQRQKMAARRNIRKASKSSRRKRSNVIRLPKRTRTELSAQEAKAAGMGR